MPPTSDESSQRFAGVVVVVHNQDFGHEVIVPTETAQKRMGSYSKLSPGVGQVESCGGRTSRSSSPTCCRMGGTGSSSDGPWPNSGAGPGKTERALLHSDGGADKVALGYPCRGGRTA